MSSYKKNTKKLTDEQKRQIKRSYNVYNVPVRMIAEFYKIAEAQVVKILGI